MNKKKTEHVSARLDRRVFLMREGASKCGKNVNKAVLKNEVRAFLKLCSFFDLDN